MKDRTCVFFALSRNPLSESNHPCTLGFSLPLSIVMKEVHLDKGDGKVLVIYNFQWCCCHCCLYLLVVSIALSFLSDTISNLFISPPLPFAIDLQKVGPFKVVGRDVMRRICIITLYFHL